MILKMKSRNLRKKYRKSRNPRTNLGNYLPSEARFYNLLEARGPRTSEAEDSAGGTNDAGTNFEKRY